MRNLVDLWQAARKRCREQPPEDEHRSDAGERAIELVAEMLNRAVFESHLPEWACNYLCDGSCIAIGRAWCASTSGATRCAGNLKYGVRGIIDFPSGADAEPSSESSPLLFSQLVLHTFDGYTIQLTQSGEEQHSVELEPSVSGWLMLLHDLLTRCQGPRIAITHDTKLFFDENPVLVQTHHRALLSDDQCFDLKLTWTMPGFDTFFDFERVTQQWSAFVEDTPPQIRPRAPNYATNGFDFS